MVSDYQCCIKILVSAAAVKPAPPVLYKNTWITAAILGLIHDKNLNFHLTMKEEMYLLELTKM